MRLLKQISNNFGHDISTHGIHENDKNLLLLTMMVKSNS